MLTPLSPATPIPSLALPSPLPRLPHQARPFTGRPCLPHVVFEIPLQFPRHLPKPPPESPAFAQRPTYYGPGALNSGPLQPEMSDTRLQQTVLRDAFFKTRSRVVRPAASLVLSTMFSHPSKPPKTPCPLSMWSKVDEATVSGVHEDSFWAIFESHEESCSGERADFLAKIRRFEFGEASVKEAVAFHPSAPSPIDHNTSAGHTISPLSTSNPYIRRQDTLGSPVDSNPTAYTISSNPPNPKTSFRIGDWICSGINCAAHNFGRNVACIVCGRSRPAGPQIGSIPQDQTSIAQQVNHLSPLRCAAQPL
ncbi:hypothetical protein A0H81_05415 [Grifola frondosa]|uniref:RanBP2-type domain-containing protein n=1 Tax=Grifola frondosa TaxID=5627 RepID=A0A1C7MDT2_GRIFR|nr:hypothetical protein A0H81_05415 [Grifola frondosa]